MAGVETDFLGEAWAGRRHQRRLSAAGAAARSRQGRARQRHGGRRREEGDARPLQRARRELFRRDGRRDGASSRTRSTPRDLWDLDTQVEQALDALRCPPGDAEVDEAVGRREAPRGADEAAAVEARHPAARRADQPSRRRERRRGSSITCATIPARVILVTHDRYFLDNITEWTLELDRGRGRALQGQLFVLARAEGQAAAQSRGKQDEAKRAHACARARVDQGEPQGAAGQVQGAHHAPMRSCWRSRPRSGRQGADHRSRRARGSATWSSRPST